MAKGTRPAADDADPAGASPTVAQGNAHEAPPNVEVAPQDHTRDSAGVSGSQDLPVGNTPSVETGNVVPNLRPEGVGPTGLAVGQVNTNTAKKSQTEAFLSITGYTAKDVIGSNAERRTFVTANGGKYELSPKGKKVRVLSGPIPPGPKEEKEDDDD